MKQIKPPQPLLERTNEVLDELEREVFGTKRQPRVTPKTGIRAGAMRPLYGMP